MENNKQTWFHQYLGFIRCRQLDLSYHFDDVPSFALDTSLLPKPELIKDIELGNNLVLGKRVEKFFHHYLENYTSHKVIGFGIQISEAKRTIGEIDYITQNNHGQLNHVELACKFYLYIDHAGHDETTKWLGPNRKDSLVQKIKKLKSKQFPLLKSEQAQTTIASLGINGDITQALCFKAFLFLPYTSDSDYGSHDGHWLSLASFIDNFNRTKFTFFIPQKQDWVATPCDYYQPWGSFDAIIASLTEYVDREFSPMIWVKEDQGSYLKLFVVWW